MDRQIIYPGVAPLDTDVLNTSRNALVAIGKLAGAAFGTASIVNGLAVTPGTGLMVSVAPGEIYALQNVDDTPYGSLAADTANQVVKQGLLRAAASLACPAPATAAGQSVNYLIQAAFSETDAGTTALPSFSAGNPLQVWVGPLHDGTLQASVRQDLCVVSVVAGNAAATGTQTTPAPTGNAIGLAVVTVAFGQTSITGANITPYPGASLVPQSGLASNVTHAIYTRNVAGNTDVTLTAQEAAYPLLTLTGALTGNINVIVPAVSRQRVVSNQTSGAFAVTVRTAAGAGVAVPQGRALSLYCDGAGVLAANSSGGQAPQGAFRNLRASATGIDANVTVLADEIVLQDAGNSCWTVRGVALTINSAAAGANGLDAGMLAASTWYSVWVICNPAANAVAGVISASATAPALPAGYTHKARIGWMRTDGSASKFPLSFVQSGRNARYKVAAGSNVAAIPVISSGAMGSVTAPTWVAAPVGSFVPPSAGQIVLSAYSNGASGVMAAPNNAYGAYNSANTPPLVAFGANTQTVTGSLVLESANIYVAGVPNTQVNVLGWEDNL